MKQNLKAITPVVATALLLVVAVVAVVGFQTWFNTYSSSLFTKVDQQSGANGMTTSIDSLVGNTLYFKNGYSNLTINKVTINGKNCFVSGSYKSGMNDILLSNCTTAGENDVAVITNKGVYSSNIYLSSASSNSCPNGFILVPGNSALGISNFCVMKYDAKFVNTTGKTQDATYHTWAYNGATGNLNITSTPTPEPITNITWQQAKAACAGMGSGYHLITNNEWLTIANNALNVNTNWNSSIVGTGFMYSGHNDNNPAYALPASSNDSDGYYLTDSNQTQRRTLYLSNGNVIWDLAGNVWEWTDKNITSASRYYGGANQWMSYYSDDGTGKIATSPTFPSLMMPPNLWNANQGMGRYYDGYSTSGTYNNINESPDFCTGYCSPTAVFLRGGSWNKGARAGAFALNLLYGPSYSATISGFRCSYAP